MQLGLRMISPNVTKNQLSPDYPATLHTLNFYFYLRNYTIRYRYKRDKRLKLKPGDNNYVLINMKNIFEEKMKGIQVRIFIQKCG